MTVANKKTAATASRKSQQASALANKVIDKVRLAHHYRAADGRSAYSALNQAAFGHTKSGDPKKLRLKIEDATVLASRIYEFLEEVKPRLREQGVSRGELCRRAGLTASKTEKFPDDAKELNRLTLPPGVDARKRQIRVLAEKYLHLIEELANVLRNSVDLVAGRLLLGTSLHPLSRTDVEWSFMEKVQRNLQSIVNKVDEDCGLMELFLRTAELKASWIDEGSQACWPLWDLELCIDAGSVDLDAYRLEREVAADPKQAYYRRTKFFDIGSRPHVGWWLFGFDTGALQSDEFFYVPHAKLGYALIWDLPDRRKDPAAYELAVRRQVQAIRSDPANLEEPLDDWDPATSSPRGQTANRLQQNWQLQQVFWLLAYPHPDGKRLVPTLYCAGEEGGAYLVPLNMEALDTLADAVWVSPTEHCSLVDRLAALLVEVGEDGMNPIERNLRRTAAWLAQNPILKRQHEREERGRRLDEVFRAEGVHAMRREEDSQSNAREQRNGR